MELEGLRKIEKWLGLLTDPHVYGWSLHPMTTEIVNEYRALSEKDRVAVRKLMQQRLSFRVPLLIDWWKGLRPTNEKDEHPPDPPPELLEFSVALEFCSRIAVPEAKDTLLLLLEREDVVRDRWALSEVLTALGNLKLIDALPIFRKYATLVAESDTSWAGIAAVVAIAMQDLPQALNYLPDAIKGDLRHRNNFLDPKNNYRASEVLLERLLDLHGKNAIQPIAQKILRLTPQELAFAREIVNSLSSRNAKIIQDFGRSRGEEYVRDEKAKQQLLLQLRHALEPVNPSSTTP